MRLAHFNRPWIQWHCCATSMPSLCFMMSASSPEGSPELGPGFAGLTLRDQSRCHLILKLGNAWRTSVCVPKDIEGERVMPVLYQE